MPILGLAPSQKAQFPTHFDIESVIRPNILSLHPYRCARDDYTSGVLLDANENSIGHGISDTASSSSSKPAQSGVNDLVDPTGEGAKHLSLELNRYPDPAQREIKSRLARLRNLVDADDQPLHDHVFLGVGSDEVIDLLMRICVAPGREKILTTPPTYGMYGVCAQVNDVGVVKVPLVVEDKAFQLDMPAVCSCFVSSWLLKLLTKRS